ncbi:MAG: hypothetical protein CVU65_17075 [Deltaproteobacteria bacterium HGW-Deltaproteobacteria-22]|jgi:hypothetical protein|nr:MAG: hypothetical protein CVU65_17075 [Deltaproteobacteria bacterium HGW-Deltaproteobacteria-22]
MRCLLLLLFSGSLFACDSPQRTVHDVLGDADASGDRDVLPDLTWDVPDVPPDLEDADVADIDAQDVPDATEVPNDPDEHLIMCNRKLVAVQHPWMYSSLFQLEEIDGYRVAYDAQFRSNLETGIEEQLPDLDKTGYGGFGYINSSTEKRYIPVRSIRSLTDPRVDGEYGPWIFSVTDVVTGVTTEWDPGLELLSEDCLNYDLYSGTGRSVMGVWKMADDEGEAVLLCSGDTLDLYKINLNTGTKTVLLRGSLEAPNMIQTSNNPLFQDAGGDFVSILLAWQNTNHKEIRVWNWRTGELLWSFASDELAGLGLVVSEDGWQYYTMREQRNGDWYMRIDGYNVLTGETGSPPIVMENQFRPIPGLPGHPEYVFFNAGDGPMLSSTPTPSGVSHYYLWNRDSDVMRRVTIRPPYPALGCLVNGQAHTTIVYADRFNGCYYRKNLIDAGIMDPLGNLLPEP